VIIRIVPKGKYISQYKEAWKFQTTVNSGMQWASLKIRNLQLQENQSMIPVLVTAGSTVEKM
jgi:hypothetical protein